MSALISHFWKEQTFRRFAGALVRNVYWFLAGALLLTALGVYGAFHIRIDSDYMAFLPESFPGVKNLQKVIRKTGGFGNFMVVIEGSAPEVRRRFAKELAEKASGLSWVDYVEYKKDWEKIEQSKFLFLSVEDLESIRHRIDSEILKKKNPMVISFTDERDEGLDFSDIERKYQATSFGTAYFEDPQQRYTVVIVWPKGSMTQIDFVKRARMELDALISEASPGKFDPGLTVGVGGEFRTKIDEYDALIKDVYSSAFITLGGIALLLLFFYRRKRAIFSVLVPLVLGIVWTIGLTYVFVGRLNLLTVFLVAILLGLGMDYGIYFFSRFLEERARGKGLEEAIAKVLHDTGRATLSSALATMIAFLTLTFTDFKGFQEFGFLASLGVVVIFIAFLFCSPVMWVLSERFGFGVANAFSEPPAVIRSVPLSRAVVWIGFTLAILGLASLPFIRFEYDYGRLRSKSGSYSGLSGKIHEVFPLSKTPAVIVTSSLEEAREVVDAVRAKIPGSKTIDTVKSMLDFMPEDLQAKREILASIESLINRNRKHFTEKENGMLERYLPYLRPADMRVEDLPKGLLRQFTGLPGTPGHLVFIYDKVRLSDARNAMRYADEIREIRTASGKVFHPSEGSFLFADALRLMIKESNFAFWVMLAGVFLILVWDFRDWRKALIVILPLCMGLAMTFGAMFVGGVKINIFNLVVFPILIGVGMDSTIHLYHRFMEGLREGELLSVIRATVNPLLLATLTNMLGFGSTLTSDHQGLASIGIVAVIGLAMQLCASLLFFPAFLKWILPGVRNRFPH